MSTLSVVAESGVRVRAAAVTRRVTDFVSENINVAKARELASRAGDFLAQQGWIRKSVAGLRSGGEKAAGRLQGFLDKHPVKTA